MAQGIPLVSHSLTVLVPALNEVDNVRPTIDRLLRALSITVEDFEILVIDDGSTDGTGKVADELAAEFAQVRAFHNPINMGLGYCYLQGVKEATKHFFVYIPGDNTWPYRSFVDLFGNLGKADVITSYSTNPEVRTPVRRVVSAAYTRTLNLIYGLHLRYYNGLTIYPIDLVRGNPPKTSGFGFQAEMLLRAIHRGLSYLEVAIPIDERTAGGSKAVTLKNVVSVVQTVVRVYAELRMVRPGGPRIGRSDAAQTIGTTTNPLRIVITGGSSGIGAELVKALAKDGHVVFTCARREDRLWKVTEGETLARSHVCDVSNEAQVAEFVSWVGSQTDRIDVLLNCAGGFGAIGPIETTDSEEWFSTFRVNLFGTYLMIKKLLPLFAGSSDARIINLSGGGAFSPFPNYSAYACSKAAIVRLTECLASEFASRGIAVNALAPGFVATEAHEATLAAGPEKAGSLHFRRTRAILVDGGGADLANVVECARTLLSPCAQGLTGKTISANFDPWRTSAFTGRIADIARSDLWTMRRLNIVNLPEGSLKQTLGEAWASHGTQR